MAGAFRAFVGNWLAENPIPERPTAASRDVDENLARQARDLGANKTAMSASNSLSAFTLFLDEFEVTLNVRKRRTTLTRLVARRPIAL